MKVAHIIMAYKNPSQVRRLVERLSHPNFDIYIHLDKKIDIKSFEKIEELEGVSFIADRTLCNWGGFSFVRAITNSMREVLLNGIKYEYINLLSGQDYPIKSSNYIYDFYLRNQGKSFISFEELGYSDWWKHAISRYELFHFTDINVRGRYAVQRLLNRIMPRRKFPVKCKLYGSAVSSWWTITPECANYIIDYLDSNPGLLRFMKYTWAADEFLYATIIMNSPFKEKAVNDNLRQIEWENGRPNPRIFDDTDLNNLIKSEKLFARKFDIEINHKVLDMIDLYVHRAHKSD